MLTAKIGGLTYLVIPGLLYACWKLWRDEEGHREDRPAFVPDGSQASSTEGRGLRSH